MSGQGNLYNDPLNEERFGPLDENENSIMRILGRHRGRAGAIKGPSLLDALGWERTKNNDRKLRGIIHQLREDHGCCIMSGCAGFYMAETADEMKKFYQENHKKAMSILVMLCRVFKKNMAELVGQMSLAAPPEEGK